MDNAKIMGQDIDTLLTIKDKSTDGRISFFIVICIIVMAYILYNIAVILWSSRKEALLIKYRSEIYKTFKKKEQRKHAPSEVPMENEERNKVRSLPKNEDIEKAMVNLSRFHRKKYL